MEKTKAPYDVLTVAREIIEYSRVEAQKEQSPYFVNMYKLNTMIYYAQGAFLGMRETPLFKEEIMAASWGAKVDSQKLYCRYSKYGSVNIPEAYYTKDPQYESTAMADKDKALLHKVVDLFKEKPNSESLALIHEERLYQRTSAYNGIIPTSWMKEEFENRLTVKKEEEKKLDTKTASLEKKPKPVRGIVHKKSSSKEVSR